MFVIMRGLSLSSQSREQPAHNIQQRIVQILLVASLQFAVTPPLLALQTVTLNFDTVSLADPTDEYVYSMGEKEAIKGLLESIYLSDPMDPTGGPFGVKFDIFDPLFPPVPFTTSIAKFNNGFMGGAAEKLDFRNTDDNDDVDVNALGLLKAFDGTTKSGGGTWTLPELTSSSSLVMASANLAAHELGHALGLRHHDSFGPLTTGIGVSGTSYEPAYIGPTGGTNASFHVMGLASTVALNADTLLTPSWLSERSAMKLTFNGTGAVDPEVGVLHGSPAEAQPVPFAPIMVANTHNPPDPFFPDPVDPTPLTAFAGFAGGIIGATLDAPFALDYYSFDAPAGTIVTIEVISKVIADTDPTRLPDPVDMTVELIDSTFSPVPYPVAVPFTINDDQFESTDSILIDVVLPTTGTYFIDVRASGKAGADITGEYELYVMGFLPPPPPTNFGNYDLDLEVDGFDFLMWQRGESPDPFSASDLAAWEANYGLVAPLSATSEAVPEPTTWIAMLIGMMAVLFRRGAIASS